MPGIWSGSWSGGMALGSPGFTSDYTRTRLLQPQTQEGGLLTDILGSVIGPNTGGLGDVVGAIARVGLPIAAEMINRHNQDRPPTHRSYNPTAQERRDQAGIWDRAQELLGIPDDSMVGRIGDAITGGASSVLHHSGGNGMANGLTIPHSNHPALFRARQSTAVGQRVIPVMNPITGKTHFFGDLGTPLLFSRDFAAHKRVNRLARKANRGKSRSRKRR